MTVLKSIIHLLLLISVFIPLSAVLAEGPFQGQWESDFGVLDFTQEREKVTGTYSCCNGVITGQASASHLKFQWKDPTYGNGWGEFVLSEDSNRLEGVWGYSGQRVAKGKWNAVRFAAPSMRGTPSYWTVSGLNNAVGSLDGEAELFIADGKVSGKIEGKYSTPIQKQIQKVNVFNYVEGTVTEQGMQLHWRNPIDGSAGTMELARHSAERLSGTWKSGNGNSRGRITFVASKHKTNADLNEILQHQSKQRRAEQLLQSAMNASSSDEATCHYQKAVKLYREIGDLNKVGYALYGQATDELNRGNYDKALQLYNEVLALDNAIDPNIRSLATTGRDMVRDAKTGYQWAR